MKRLLFCLLFLGLCSPAFAGGQCYSSTEVQAEQLLRLHSELLVISLTCRQSSTGGDLVKGYTGFTSKHITALHQAEETMKAFYEKAHKGKGTAELDRLRTRLANECGHEVVIESPNGYCASRRDKVVSLYDSPPDALYGYAARLYAGIPTAAPVCRGATKANFEGDSASKVSFRQSQVNSP